MRALLAGLSEEDLKELQKEAGSLRGSKKLRRKLAEIKKLEARGGEIFHGTFKEYLNKTEEINGHPYGDEKNDPYVLRVIEEGDHEHLSRATHSTLNDHYVDWGDGWSTEEELESSTLERDWVLPGDNK
jgi:hypothetical protein